ncbi:hypothetical protein SAMD00023353_1502070 [Rosellinia necatrix]|uniref:Oxidoreductase acuF-like C2H2 type zinc-finger domain-containing protein n=1 Tax=Rosellinia necatrix TaxID=77044 RepID=A0A1W2TRH2_ROSNE|nr:hypothetical protein SAMD00023353_1502070 [Rosellinia necatrix]
MASPKPYNSISAEVNKVKSLLTDLVNAYVDTNIDVDEGNPLSASTFQDMLDRFKLWAGSLGAMHQPQSKLSLEQRLRRAPEVLVHVHEHLSEMQESLHDALEINNVSERDASNAGAAGSKVQHFTNSVDRDELSAQELAEEVSECIRSLFRLSIVIRGTSQGDRFATALKSTQSVFMDTFDIDYVAEKFPKLRSANNEWLKRRLGSAISKRRQFMKYCYDHKLHLEAEDEVEGSAKATTFVPVNINEETPVEKEEDYAVSLMTGTTVTDSDNSLSLPELNILSPNGEPFGCPICCTIQTFQHEGQWKRHAFGDLKAYVCTRGRSEDCGRLFFADRSTWFQHELSMHLSSYRCSLCDVKSIFRRDELRQHLNSSHGPLTHDQLSSLVGDGIHVPTSLRPQDCPFCEDWSIRLQEISQGRGSSHQRVSISRMRRHVATHQEQLALFAVPRFRNTGPEESPEPMSDESVSHNRDVVYIRVRRDS